MPNVQAPHLQSLASGLPKEVGDKLYAAFGASDKFGRDVAQSLNLALTVGDSLQIFTPYTQARPLAIPTDWTAFTYQNSWVDYGGTNETGAYNKSPSGWVQLKGLTKDGTAVIGTVITTLSAGYRPALSQHFAVPSNGAFGCARVDSNGEVVFVAGSNTWFALDQVGFYATTRTAAPPSVFPFDVLWPKQYPPTAVIAQCADVNQTSPSAFALQLPDWGTSTKGGQTMIKVRNIPGLIPGQSYAVTLVVF